MIGKTWGLKGSRFAGELTIKHGDDPAGALTITHSVHGDWPRGAERYFGDPATAAPFGDDYHFGGAPAWAAFGFDPSDLATVKRVQAALNALGVASPLLTVDGESGPKTAAAIKTFQLQKKIAPTGNIDDTTLMSLGLAPTGKPVLPEGGKAGAAALTAALAQVDTKVAAGLVAGVQPATAGVVAHIKAAIAKLMGKL